MKNRRIAIIVVALIFCLIVLDQACKLLVDNLIELPTDLMTDTALLHLHPTIHDKNYVKLLNYSLDLSLPFPLVASLSIAVTSLIIALIISVLCIYNKIVFYDHKDLIRPYSKLTVACFSLIIAGVACSLLDQTFWGGSLDFICHSAYKIVSGKRVIHHSIFDLKDMYLWSGAVLSVIRVYLWERSTKSIDKVELKDKFRHPIKYLNLIKVKNTSGHFE